jgi:isopentenyl-diphosphate Delta-isomerase
VSSADLTARKHDHLRIAAGRGVGHAAGPGLDAVRLRHRALPERDLADVSLRCEILGRPLRAPLFVSAMTGGVGASTDVNARLAEAAAEHGVAMTLGSGRALLDDPGLIDTYLRRGTRPRPPLLLANLGAAHLRGPQGLDDAERLVDLLEADGLSLHLNPLQEAVQPEGDPAFAGVADRIALVVTRVAPRPVVVKEVGFGLDGEDVALLRDAGVATIDVAGAGGTNWALVEGRRDPRAHDIAAAFRDWGVPTAHAIREARRVAPRLPLIASGGLRDGVDAAKCLALGASAAGLARVLLVAAQADRASEALATIIAQLRIAVWATGAAGADALGPANLQEPA